MRRAWALLLLLGCGEESSTPAVSVGLPKLTIDGAYFRDPAGNAVILRGVNYSHRTKSKPYWSWQKPEHFAQIRAWGFNCVRYLLLWDAIDEAYLDHVEQVLEWAEASGIYVLLDMHQDLFGAKFGGDGAPDWAATDDEPVLLQPWFLTYFTPGVMNSFTQFWSSEELQSKFVEAWQAVADRAKDHSNVVGYDLFNEPFPGWAWPWEFEAGALSQFYAKVAAGIREVDPGAIVFLEPAAVTANNGVPHSLHPVANAAYAPHFYDPLLLAGGGYTGRWLAELALGIMKAQSFGPLFVGEFGVLRDNPHALEAMRDQCEILDAVQACWTYWDFNPDPGTNAPLEVDHMNLDETHPAFDVLVRPYPRSVAGTPKSWSFRDGVFRIDAPGAVIYLPEHHFPTFTVEGATWSWDASSRLLTVAGQGGEVVVRP